MQPSRTRLFVVGRLSKAQGRRVVFLREVTPPFPGPWALKAVFAG